MKTFSILSAFLFICGITISHAQVTTATDFTTNDCNGNSHHLFAELDSGKVIVVAFVMPCSSCIGPSLTAYNVSQSFETDFPGRVKFYLSDDVTNTSCATLSGWASNNSIGPNITVFSSVDFAESDYGSSAMPKIVVLGGTDHHVYFLGNNSAAGNATAIEDAINSALSANGISNHDDLQISLNIYPNPSASEIMVAYSLVQSQDLTIQIVNAIGEIIKSDVVKKQSPGDHQLQISTEEMDNGIYFVRFISNNITKQKSFSIIK